MAKQKRKPSRQGPAGRQGPSGKQGRSSGPKGSPTPKASGRPATAGRTGANQRSPSPGLRGRVERISWPFLRKLHELPRWLIVGVSLVLLLAGLLAPRPAAVPALAVIVLFLGWLTYLAWPEGDGRRKAMRVIALGLAVVAVVVRAATG